jgi:5'-nucleotidase
MPKEKFLVMVTNDDGVQSPGIIALADAIARFSKVKVIGPESPQSAAGMSLTFHKPLRVNKLIVGKHGYFAVSGSPADSVMVGVHKFLPRRPDVVVSGINIGDNITIQDILASGTIAAALQAALLGIPAIAFSMDVPEERTFLLGTEYPEFQSAARVAAQITREVLLGGLPKGVDLLNVNFPWEMNPNTGVKITTVERRKYKDYVIERKDPRGRPYFWLWGARLGQVGVNSDAYAIQKEHAISISPISLNFSSPANEAMRGLGERISWRIRRNAD